MDTCYLCNGKLKRKNIDIVRYFEAKVSAKIDKRIQEMLRKKYSIERIAIPVIQF